MRSASEKGKVSERRIWVIVSERGGPTEEKGQSDSKDGERKSVEGKGEKAREVRSVRKGEV